MAETQRSLLVVGGLNVAAALLHGLIIEEHLAEWWGYGVFFMLAMMAQGVYGFTYLGTQMMEGKPLSEHWSLPARRRWYLFGMLGNLFLVVLYLVSRTVGIPAGPAAGETEPVTFFGVFVKLIEFAAFLALARLWLATKGQGLGATG